MTDLAIAWRDEQIEMLKSELRLAQEALRQMTLAYDHQEARAERAETALANLKEEVAEWRLTA